MNKIIKDVINSKSYKLEEMLYKINKMYVEGMITEAHKTELDELARKNANAQNSYASADQRITDIYRRLDEIDARLNKIEGVEVETPEQPDQEKEYPEYVQPTGAHDAYNVGDCITFKDKKYECTMEGCVWSPEVYPNAWKEVIEMDQA